MGLIFLIYFKVNLRFILKAKNKDKAKFYSLKLSLIFWGHIPAHRACLLLNKGNNFDIDFVEFFSLENQTTNFFLIKGKVFWNLRECFTLFYFKFNFFDTSSHKQRLIATFYSLRFSLIFWGAHTNVYRAYLLLNKAYFHIFILILLKFSCWKTNYFLIKRKPFWNSRESYSPVKNFFIFLEQMNNFKLTQN